MSLVPTPRLDEGATEAFRVGDMRYMFSDFTKKLSDMLAAGPSTANGDAAIGDLSAHDLRLTSSEEALRHLKMETTENKSSYAEIRVPPQIPSAAAEGQETATAKARNGGKKVADDEDHRIFKQQVVDAYTAAVEIMKQEQAAEREKAAQYLSTLQQESAVSVKAALPHTAFKRRSQSYLNVNPSTRNLERDIAQRSHGNDVAFELEKGSKRVLGGVDLEEGSQVDPSEVVVHVAVYLPQAPSRVSEEWLVLGSQSLSELKDVIYCLTEVNIRNVEAAENRRRRLSCGQPMALSKPSAYFYIEGTFYVDTRDRFSVDYSEVIRNYNKDHAVRAPLHPPPCPASQPLGAPTSEFTTDRLQDRRFEDLWLRLGPGSPGLYCHQGGCEHLLVFKDVRMLDPDTDPALKSQYPFKLATPSTPLLQHKQCEACGQRGARHVTYEDKNVPHTPFFWCNECFKLMHYDAEGQALYTDFRVFPYTHDYQPMLMQVGPKKPANTRKARHVGRQSDSD